MPKDHDTIKPRSSGELKIIYVGGPLPYIWVGKGDQYIGTVEHKRDVSKLREFCDAVLRSKRRS